MKTPRPFQFSYTKLSTFKDVCQYQFFRTYIKGDIPYVATEAMEAGKQAHTALQYRVSGGKPLPESMRQWEHFAAPFDGKGARTELELAITRDGRPTEKFAADVWGRAVVDVAVLYQNRAMIFDWKTGNSKYEKPFELEIHALMLKIHNPQIERVSGSFVWLKDNRMGTPYELSHFDKTWVKISKIVGEIEACSASGEWRKNATPLCAWCRVFDCENNSNPNREE